jgi:hypothetical protein
MFRFCFDFYLLLLTKSEFRWNFILISTKFRRFDFPKFRFRSLNRNIDLDIGIFILILMPYSRTVTAWLSKKISTKYFKFYFQTTFFFHWLSYHKSLGATQFLLVAPHTPKLIINCPWDKFLNHAGCLQTLNLSLAAKGYSLPDSLFIQGRQEKKTSFCIEWTKSWKKKHSKPPK